MWALDYLVGNAIRLLRQYFPKETNITVHSQAKLNQVARQMNEGQERNRVQRIVI